MPSTIARAQNAAIAPAIAGNLRGITQIDGPDLGKETRGRVGPAPPVRLGPANFGRRPPVPRRDQPPLRRNLLLGEMRRAKIHARDPEIIHV